MKDFKKFVDSVISKWRSERPAIVARLGAILPANRVMGDWAEKQVVSRIKDLKPEYSVFMSKGSQSPADIYAICKRQSFYHIMLIQVKSSISYNEIAKLKEVDLKLYYELGKLVKNEFGKQYSELKEKPLLISIGYIGIFNEVKRRKTIPVPIKSLIYKTYVSNFGNVDLMKAKEIVRKAQNTLIR